jgi:hypothetical protein
MLVLLIQLFWLSFVLIGLAVVLLRRHLAVVHQSKIYKYLRTTHPVIQLVLLFVLGLLPFVPVTVLSYIFEWPILALELVYLVILALSVGVLVVQRKVLIARMHRPHIPRTTFILAAVAGGSLLFDYIVALKVGAPLYGDAPVQLAKITFFQHVHFALTDPYYSGHGVVDPRYSTNLLDAYQALAASLLRTTAIKVWMYSYGVYRLLVWLSLFGLLWMYLGKKYRYFAYIVIALMPFLWGGYLIFADLPDRIVLAWVMLLLIGLKLWLEEGSWPLLVVASVLIASTHALLSLVMLGYLLLVMAVLWVSRTMPLKCMLAPAVCVLLLALPVALNLYYPNHTNQDAQAFLSGAISGTPPHPIHYGPFVVSQLPYVPVVALLFYALFAFYMWFMYKTERPKLLLATYFALFLGLVMSFNVGILSLVGYGLIVYQVKQRAQRIAVAALVCYYGLIAYNPVFWHFESGKIPPWIVARFQELNVFGMVAATVGLLFIAVYPLMRMKHQKLAYGMCAVVACLSLWYFAHPVTNDYSIASMWDSRNILLQNGREQSLSAISALAPDLQGHLVYSNDPDVAIRVPGIVPVNVYSFNPENESPMTNIALRQSCSLHIAQTMQLSDLQAADITRIITDPPYSLKLAALAKTRPYLSLIAQAQGYQVYAVQPGVASLLGNSCAVPFGQ